MTNEIAMSQTNSLGGKGFQIGEQNNYFGMSYGEIRDLCIDLIKRELDSYKNEAAIEAQRRNDVLLNSLLEKLRQEKMDDASVSEEFKNPDMQYTYLDAQKTYIRLGTKELEETLTDLLVQRIKEKERTLLQIALREAITNVSMLLPKQLDVLALIVLFMHIREDNIVSIDSLKQYLNSEIMPFVNCSVEAQKTSFFSHLSYTKVGNIEFASQKLGDILKDKYPGLFCYGYYPDEVDSYAVRCPGLFQPCFHNPSKWQIDAVDKDRLLQKLTSYSRLSEKGKEAVVKLFSERSMSEAAVKSYMCEMDPRYVQLFDLWDNTLLSNFTLTTVGVVLGAVHAKRVTNKDIDLSKLI